MRLESLKEIRKMKKISIKEVAEYTGLNPDRVSLIERGKVNPSFASVQKMCEALGVQIGIILL